LGEGIIDLVNLLNLELIIIGGRVVQAYPAMVERIGQTVLTQSWPFSRQNLVVAAASLSKNILLQGAVSLVLDEVFFPYGISINQAVFR
jgi:predicted NBD/HSP70 family sugar kinase